MRGIWAIWHGRRDRSIDPVRGGKLLRRRVRGAESDALMAALARKRTALLRPRAPGRKQNETTTRSARGVRVRGGGESAVSGNARHRTTSMCTGVQVPHHTHNQLEPGRRRARSRSRLSVFRSFGSARTRDNDKHNNAVPVVIGLGGFQCWSPGGASAT